MKPEGFPFYSRGADFSGVFTKNVEMDIHENLQGDTLCLFLKGDLNLSTAESVLRELKKRMEGGAGSVALCLKQITHIDSAGISVLMRLYESARAKGISLRFRNPAPSVRAFLDFLPFDPTEKRSMKEEGEPLSLVDSVGEVTLTLVDRAVTFLAFTMESVQNALTVLFRRKGKASLEILRQIEVIGLGAFPIVGLISFIIGSIMAFQGASQLRQLGATGYVANLVGVALTRELGPLITAILVAGRSGSAIAAEIGTMKVSEEVDALRTMGMNPNQVLVSPKLLATILSVPCLTAIADVVGMVGGYVIGVFVLGISPVTYYDYTREALLLSDVTTGLLKSFVFGLIIVLVGCRQGFIVKGGGEGVGKAATTSVVRSIELIIAADLIFTALFYYFV